MRGNQIMDPVLASGIGIYILYLVIDRAIIKLPSYISMSAMLVSLVCIIVGIYRAGKNMRDSKKKNKN